MQMTLSPIKRNNADLNKLIIGIRPTMDPFLTDFRLHFKGKMISENIPGSILAT